MNEMIHVSPRLIRIKHVLCLPERRNKTQFIFSARPAFRAHSSAILQHVQHTPTETPIFILVGTVPRPSHAAVRPQVPGSVPLAMFGRDSLPVRETLASSHVAGAPPAHQH